MIRAGMDLRVAAVEHPPVHAGGPDRVLIVDDDELILKALGRILESAGYEPRCYVAPDDALAAIESDAPVVVISDYMMPTMDGVTFLKQARSRFPGAVRILCTAAEDFRVALQAVNSGEVFRIISKPWHQQELLSTVNQAAEAARLRRENERLTHEVQRQNGQLREINLRLEEMVRMRTQALLEGLIAALDYRDAETQWHSRRVSLYARRLAQQLGITEPELTVIEHGALLHDIGKIGVRDRVLLKPGPLTSDEWTEMKRHPELGWALLQRVDYLRPASAIVLQHQEKGRLAHTHTLAQTIGEERFERALRPKQLDDLSKHHCITIDEHEKQAVYTLGPLREADRTPGTRSTGPVDENNV
jgi:response regulator RpfG family c-di-GMP phosphodiesterase